MSSIKAAAASGDKPAAYKATALANDDSESKSPPLRLRNILVTSSGDMPRNARHASSGESFPKISCAFIKPSQALPKASKGSMSAKISAIKNWNIPDKSQLLSGCKEIEIASAASTGSNKLAAFAASS